MTKFEFCDNSPVKTLIKPLVSKANSTLLGLSHLISF